MIEVYIPRYRLVLSTSLPRVLQYLIGHACMNQTRPTLKTDVIEYNTLKMTSHKHIDNAGGPLGGAFNEFDTFRNSDIAAMPFEGLACQLRRVRRP